MKNSTVILMLAGGIALVGVIYLVTRPAPGAAPVSFFGGGGTVATGGDTDLQAGFAALGSGLNAIGGIATSVINQQSRETAAGASEA